MPEWYFLPFYAILRSTVFEQLFAPLSFLGWFGISAKLAGVLAMFGSIAVLFVLPWLDTSKVRSATFRPIYKWVFWLLVIDCVILTWVGGQVPNQMWSGSASSRRSTTSSHFLVILPLLGKLERPRQVPTSIDKPVLDRGLAAQPAE